MTKRSWHHQPALYRRALEHFMTSKEEFVIPCSDVKAAYATRHGLHRYFNQTTEEADRGNVDAAQLVPIVHEVSVHLRETVVYVALRSQDVNIDFEEMARRASEKARLMKPSAEVTSIRSAADKPKNTYYDAPASLEELRINPGEKKFPEQK